MSDPSPITPLDHHHHHHQHQHQHHPLPPPPPLPAPPQPPSSPSSSAASLLRDYRKGNWTLQETLVLITAKRLDDDRRAGNCASSSSSASGCGVATPRSAEQRWKWVENYCWKHGCLRSQNQCNDKWDNLLRDYKKVRDFETRAAASAADGGGSGPAVSYWAMERHERKERNLPTNLALEVFESLTDVLGRRAARRGAATTPVSARHPPPPPLLAAPPLPPPSLPPPPPTQPSVSVEMTESDESEEIEGDQDPEAKRRRLKRLGSSVVRSASVLARTLLTCEEKRERRHRELLELEERRLRLEEDRTEMRRQGFAGLISAVNNLSGAIYALVSDHRNGDSR